MTLDQSHRDQTYARKRHQEPLRVAIGQFGELPSLGLWVLLNAEPDISVVGVEMAFDELVLLATEPRRPAVVVLDATRMRGAPLRRLHELVPDMGIVALLASDDRHAAPSLISDGAAECLLIDARPSEIVQTVWRAARFSPSEEHQQPTLISSINDDNTAVALKSLTKRQAEVLALLIRGNTRATIALTLGIKESTVHVHIKAIYKNLGLNSRSALREWAVSTASLKNCT